MRVFKYMYFACIFSRARLWAHIDTSSVVMVSKLDC